MTTKTNGSSYFTSIALACKATASTYRLQASVRCLKLVFANDLPCVARPLHSGSTWCALPRKPTQPWISQADRNGYHCDRPQPPKRVRILASVAEDHAAANIASPGQTTIPRSPRLKLHGVRQDRRRSCPGGLRFCIRTSRWSCMTYGDIYVRGYFLVTIAIRNL